MFILKPYKLHSVVTAQKIKNVQNPRMTAVMYRFIIYENRPPLMCMLYVCCIQYITVVCVHGKNIIVLYTGVVYPPVPNCLYVYT